MIINEHKIVLNDDQAKAVLHTNGPLLVIAGAGSGKTRIITTRITYLMQQYKVPAISILALTFTNKAALEMKERISTLIGINQELPFIGTFHSYCVRLLKKNRHLLDTPFISILDDDDQKKLLQDILKRNNVHTQLAPRQAAYHISHMKNKNIHFDTPSRQLFDHPLMPDIYQAYEEEKRSSKMLDFDDLLLETVRLFKKNQSFKLEFQALVRHILIDEYQDTNIVQHELLRQMSLHDKQLIIDSICAVGDEDQSIYSWRGANVTNMLNFQKDFPQTTLIKVEQNYRSVQPILDIANHIIQHNTQRNPKKLWSERKASNRIKKILCLSEYQEADAITQFITTSKRHDPSQEIAILYRTHAQSRPIEESLLKHSIPYKIIGGIQFYERKEIKDLLAYLKLISNPFDRVSLFRIINTPTRGFGQKFEEQLYSILQKEPFIPIQKVCALLQDKIPPAKQKNLFDFATIFDEKMGHETPSTVLQHIIEKIDYIQFIKKSYERDDAQTRIENIQELMDAIKYFESQQVNTIALFLDEVTLMQEKLAASEKEDIAHKVLLMTLHAAKGLEFDTIILAGLEQGILPTARALYEESNALEEERRLFYVGITRAKERLILTHTKFRYTYGRMSEQIASQFLDELPGNLIPFEDCTYWNKADFVHHFSDWLGIKQSDPFAFAAKRNSFAHIIQHKVVSSEKDSSFIASNNHRFRLNQLVSHAKYGKGVIKKIEKRNDADIVSVLFKTGTKKIISRFLSIIR